MAYKSKNKNQGRGHKTRELNSVVTQTDRQSTLSPYTYTPSSAVETWENLYDIFCEDFPDDNTKETWLFRGENKHAAPLRTSLEKAFCDITGIKIDNDDDVNNLLQNGSGEPSIWEIERGLIRRFKRQYHHFDVRLPESGNYLEWLSIMRHYGAPNRMLDWSYSFFVAVFFAIEDSFSEEGAAMWALEKNSTIEKVKTSKKLKYIGAMLRKDEDIKEDKTWEKCFYCPKNAQLFVFPTNPFRLNERLVIQQGDLLCQGDISKSFEENLSAVLPRSTGKANSKLRKYILKFNAKERQVALLALHRMNINRATLFPGLEGFSKSLKTLMVSPKKLLYPGGECSKNDKSKKIDKKGRRGQGIS